MMRFSLSAAAAALFGGLASVAGSPAVAQEAEVTETLTVSATVQIVDQVTREVLLRDDATGEVFMLQAGPEVRNLAQLEPGDVVEATWVLSVAARMALEGEEGSAAAMVGGRAEEGAKPGALVGEAVSTVVTFLSWDAAANVATVEDAEGVVRRVAVRRPEMQAYAADLSRGDRVEITFTEAVAIGVVEK
jgi:hypothetical protein